MDTATPRETSLPRANKSEGLTLERAKQLFSTEELRADSDFAFVYDYYHPNVRFQDPIQELHGRDEFVDMNRRLLRRCSELELRLNDSAQNGNVMFLQWTMKMRLGKGPRAALEGTTKLTLDASGRVIEHRDYFDPWGDTLDGVPLVGRAYRAVMRRLG